MLSSSESCGESQASFFQHGARGAGRRLRLQRRALRAWLTAQLRLIASFPSLTRVNESRFPPTAGWEIEWLAMQLALFSADRPVQRS